MKNYKRAKEIFEKNGLDYSAELHEKLEIYFDFLVEYNQRVNLTAITDFEGVWTKHFADSIMLSKMWNITENARVIDVGTGAGFPSVPLKLYRPDIELTLLDSLNKRIVFLDELCQRLGISCRTVHSRAEDATKSDDFRERYDLACARAVAAMPVLCEYCLPFVKVGGVFTAMKGPGENFTGSEKALEILGGEKHGVIEYTLSGTEKRKILAVKKISHTPAKYPRNSGQIKNKPL